MEEEDVLQLSMVGDEEEYSPVGEDLSSDESDDPMDNDSASVEIICEGIKVMFPKAPYPSQEEMMKEIMKGVKNSKHCLLESPTGTGKTLALLCSLLAWQDCKIKGLEETKKKLEEKRYKSWESSQMNNSQNSSSPKKLKTSENYSNQENGEDKATNLAITHVEAAIRNVPVIYYSTRTHGQINGIINQLKQTKYADVPMSILASRTQTCLNKSALNFKDGVDAACQKLTKEKKSLKPKESEDEGNGNPIVDGREVPDIEDIGACKYFSGNQYDTPKSQFSVDEDGCKKKPWFSEDLKRWGKDESRCRCPYYELKILKKEARIVFATYNHLLHGSIRKSCQIELANNVVIFDEAHNIESVCRDIASTNGSLSLGKVEKAVKHLDEAMEKRVIPSRKMEPLRNVYLAMKRLANFLRAEARRSTPQDKQLTKWGRTQQLRRHLPERTIVSMLSGIQFGPEELRDLRKDVNRLEDRVYGDAEKATEDELAFKVNPIGMRIVSGILFTLTMFFKRDPNSKDQDSFLHLDDYDKSFIISRVNGDSPVKTAMHFQSSASNKGPNNDIAFADVKIQLELRCLNPAIVFEKIKLARTIIVTSGTLSPISSFSSELNTEFDFTLQAAHTVERHRLYSCIITRYTKSSQLMNFNYNGRSDPAIQSQLFEVIRDIAKILPNGLLVFAPSKVVMASFKDKWEENGCLDQLKTVKPVYFEHEATDAVTFSKMIKEYKMQARGSSGAILFAVIRGRASEGEDFKDEEARGVITVGIPFSPYKDEGIQAKKKFNTVKKATNPNYLSGDEWYQVCAFRAMNQALGRCLRHQKDWGIICIVDSRFAQGLGYVPYLSSWVQDSLRHGRPGSLEDHQPVLKEFIDNAVAPNRDATTQLVLTQQ